MRTTLLAHGLLVLSATLAAACGDDDISCTVDETYDPAIDPANFVATIDNPLLTWTPGTKYVYRGASERIEVTVTSETRVILGVTCTVVRDTATVGGEVIEDTYDWYAQDTAGNVWYFGEDTKEYENGQVASTEGSWEAGVDGAKPGIVMKAQPAVDDAYRQEYSICEAEDEAVVVGLDEAVAVPYGNYTGCLKTRDFTRIEPDANEYKYYCPGVGLVLEEDVNSGERTELVEVTTL